MTLRESQPKPPPRCDFEIVAAIVTHEEQLCLFRRSSLVKGDPGSWHCITGYLPVGVDPLTQALAEVSEEAGLLPLHLSLLNRRQLDLRDSHSNVWRVHAFHFDSRVRTVTLNWEHDAAWWLHPNEIGCIVTVPWLHDVWRALCGPVSQDSEA